MFCCLSSSILFPFFAFDFEIMSQFAISDSAISTRPKRHDVERLRIWLSNTLWQHSAFAPLLIVRYPSRSINFSCFPLVWFDYERTASIERIVNVQLLLGVVSSCMRRGMGVAAVATNLFGIKHLIPTIYTQCYTGNISQTISFEIALVYGAIFYVVI